MRLKVIIFVAVIAMAAVGMAQSLTLLSPENMYHLQSIISKREAVTAKLDVLIMQFVSSNPQAKQMKEDADKLLSDQRDLLITLCKEAGLELSDCSVDPEKGTIGKVEKESQP